MLGSQALAGAPAATVVLGAAVGSVAPVRPDGAHRAPPGRAGRRLLRSAWSVRWSRPLAVVTDSFPLLVCGTLLIGFGNSANQLSRYAAADMVPPERRASAIGLVVWGATVGSVIGPTLVPISSDLAGAGRAAGARRPVPRAGRVRRPRGDPLVRPAPARPVRARRRGLPPRDPRGSGPEHRADRGHPPPAARGRRDHRPGHRPVRDGPDHDDDAAPHDRARPRPDCGRASCSPRTRSGCSRSRRSPGG